MRSNPVKEKLARGESCYGVMSFEFFTPGLAAARAAAGAAVVINDMEHSGASVDTIKQQLAYARGLDIVPIVRVPTGLYHLIAPILDSGALGIMVPMLETPEMARDFASWVKYPPLGKRGAAFGVAHDDYEGGDVVDKIRIANERTLTVALIETPRGVENSEAIMATPGIDMGWIGHFDLTNFMGIPAQFDHPDFVKAVKRVAKAAASAGKPIGVLDPDPKVIRQWQKRGFRMFCLGTDIQLMQNSLRRSLTELAGKNR
jgi:2-keto-3-deoxy-L-rhamnonate aldolase RhmA